MSLLMDALKRAEASKQQAGRNEPTADTSSPAQLTGLTLEPVGNEGSERGSPLPDLAAHLDALDADLEATISAPPPSPSPRQEPLQSPAPDPQREAARTMFAAKSPPPPSRMGLWIVLGLLGLAGLGIGVYFWWQLNQLNRPVTNQRPTAPISIQVSPAPGASPPSVSAPVPVPQPAAVAPESSLYSNEARPGPQEPALSSAPGTRTMPAEPAAEIPPAGQLRLSKSRPQADPNILRGWRNLQAGNLETARKDYELGLKGDPKNVDALLGLASIAQRQGRAANAERYYQLALEADPKDAAAQAAVIGLSAANDPTSAESRLKNALSAQPDSPTLNFALGNLLAREQRWNEAQQAYFNAVTGDSDNPDYLFNLAVSLDQIRQGKLAAQYYRQALEAAEKRQPAFDRARVQQRLNQLAPAP